MDPTAETASWRDLPGADQEKLALVFFEDETKFLRAPLKSPQENETKSTLLIHVLSQGDIEVQLKLDTWGTPNMELRSFKYLKPAQRRQIVENWVNSLAPGGRLKEFHFSNLDNFDLPVSLWVTYEAPKYLKKAGDVWMFTIPGVERETGACGKESRIYPLVFSTTSLITDEVKILIPEEFQLKYIPENVTLEIPGLIFQCSYQVKEGVILYHSLSKRGITGIGIDYYKDYKSFMESAARESRKQILLKRKPNKGEN